MNVKIDPRLSVTDRWNIIYKLIYPTDTADAMRQKSSVESSGDMYWASYCFTLVRTCLNKATSIKTRTKNSHIQKTNLYAYQDTVYTMQLNSLSLVRNNMRTACPLQRLITQREKLIHIIMGLFFFFVLRQNRNPRIHLTTRQMAVVIS